MTVKEAYNRAKNFISEDIWKVNIDELTKAKAKLVKYIKVIIITLKTFSKEKIGIQAVALSFFATMAVVPFIFLMFTITNGFGLSDRLVTLIHEYFSSSQDIVDMLLGFADNIIATAQSSVVGLISALLFCWTVLWMMFSVERAFNNVWRVHKSRNLFKRIGFYILIIFVAPFVIMLFFSGSIVYTNALASIGLGVQYFRTVSSILAWVIFYVVATMTFSVMYKFIPNHKVIYSNALKASIASGLVFTIFQYIYLETQMFITRLNTVYGAVAMIPFFMLWMNVGWFIILFGSELSYAFQHVDNYNLDD
ncbi:MAG: YihY/virulence factor BrkB family protein [Bacteroidales bacterium]|nr:YihY/virulence factor BrkB family protein [Bacteroidales bacterium]